MPNRPTVVALGEILWDVFPDGPKFGGAAANFACTTAELAAGAADIYIVGAVGPDPLGREAVELLASHGVDTAYVQLADYPTGRVNVTLDHAGKPTFEIAENTAWDHVAWSNELNQLAQRADAICFGTLAQRSSTSRDTIRRFLQATRPECLRILDINLRPPFWTEEVVRESLELANVLKLNDTELPVLAGMLNLSGSSDEQLTSLLGHFNLRMVAFTRGADGATLLSSSGERSELPAEPVKIVDTVGAGDAYTAALAIGLLNGVPLAEINASGNRVAAFVCSQAGATPHFPRHLRIVGSESLMGQETDGE
jgi:fructokinase